MNSSERQALIEEDGEKLLKLSNTLFKLEQKGKSDTDYYESRFYAFLTQLVYHVRLCKRHEQLQQEGK